MKKIILAMAALLLLVGCTTNKPAEANNENELINEQLMQDNLSVLGDGGYPYGVPMSFVYAEVNVL